MFSMLKRVWSAKYVRIYSFHLRQYHGRWMHRDILLLSSLRGLHSRSLLGLFFRAGISLCARPYKERSWWWKGRNDQTLFWTVGQKVPMWRSPILFWRIAGLTMAQTSTATAFISEQSTPGISIAKVIRMASVILSKRFSTSFCFDVYISFVCNKKRHYVFKLQLAAM